jgi:hypothetical protein
MRCFIALLLLLLTLFVSSQTSSDEAVPGINFDEFEFPVALA